jgi:3-deoxy-7-phosphoheptulonate synthase
VGHHLVSLHIILEGNRSVVGLMIESNIKASNQSIPSDLSQLEYGVSVTDGCIDWGTTAECLRAMRGKLKDVLPVRGRQGCDRGSVSAE